MSWSFALYIMSVVTFVISSIFFKGESFRDGLLMAILAGVLSVAIVLKELEWRGE